MFGHDTAAAAVGGQTDSQGGLGARMDGRTNNAIKEAKWPDGLAKVVIGKF